MAAIDNRIEIKAGQLHLILEFPGRQFGKGVLELSSGLADHKREVAGFAQQPEMRGQRLL